MTVFHWCEHGVVSWCSRCQREGVGIYAEIKGSDVMCLSAEEKYKISLACLRRAEKEFRVGVYKQDLPSMLEQIFVWDHQGILPPEQKPETSILAITRDIARGG